MQYRPAHTPRYRPEHSPGGFATGIHRLPSSSHAPATHSPLSNAAIGPSSTISSSRPDWRPPVPRKDDEPSHWEYGQMMQGLDNLTGSVNDLSRKISNMMALAGSSSGAPENLATRLVSRTRRRASLELGSIDDLAFTGVSHITQQQSRAQPRHVAATVSVSPLGRSAVYRPPTPPRLRPQPVHPFDMDAAIETPFSPTIPPIPTFTPLPRFGSIPSTTLDRMAQEPWSSSISEISLSPPLSPADIAAHQHSIDSHDDSALSDSAQNMFDSLTNRIQYELQHYRSSVQSVYTSEPDYLDVGTNTASNDTEQSPQDDDGEEDDDGDSLSREPSLSRFPPPPSPPPPPPPSPHVSSRPHSRALPALPRPPRPTSTAAAELCEVLPRLQTQIAILEHEWPELFMVDHKPCPELASKLHFLATLLLTSFVRQKIRQKRSLTAT
ncbi:hypothetical protein BGZ74_005817 [Mortierella antarctica]|nr:hypothetical protein BGZ74_005817 [Mortierella antarctica]